MYNCPINCKFQFSKMALVTSLSFKGLFYFLQIPRKFKRYQLKKDLFVYLILVKVPPILQIHLFTANWGEHLMWPRWPDSFLLFCEQQLKTEFSTFCTCWQHRWSNNTKMMSWTRLTNSYQPCKALRVSIHYSKKTLGQESRLATSFRHVVPIRATLLNWHHKQKVLQS